MRIILKAEMACCKVIRLLLRNVNKHVENMIEFASKI